jgi:uncharacterized protein (TIGR02996 family)
VTIAHHLELALARIANLDAARAALLAAWALAPQERLSRLVERADALRPVVTLPLELANLGCGAAAKAPDVLARIAPDPRVAHVLLELLASPPWRANPSLPFWRACCARIVATRDARILAKLEQVALAYPKTIPTTVGHKVAGYLNKAALALRDEIARVPPLDERALAACDALERALDVPARAKPTQGAQIVDVLLQAVYDAPLDDGPRLVLADHLMQRGDARGEFISLQLARVNGRADDTTRVRELELLAQSNGQWTGRIGLALEASRFVFHRGFVAYAQLPRTKNTLHEFAGDPAWHTVELFDVSWTSTLKRDRVALARMIERSPGVRGVIGVPATFLATLPTFVLAKLERLDIGALDTSFVLGWLERAARPRSLSIAEPYEHGELHALLASPQLARLEQLVLSTLQPQTWLARVEATPLPRFVIEMSNLRVELERVGDRFGKATIRQLRGHWSGFPEAVMRHIAQTLRDRAFVVDLSTPFYPGMQIAQTATTHWPTREGVVDDLDLLGR